jgi:stage V sporulation protein R
VKAQLLTMLATRGTPRVHVVDANHDNRGELRMWHQYEGVDIQMDWANITLGNLCAVWGRPVHLDTDLEGKPVRISHDGTEARRVKRDREDGEPE